MGEGLAGHSLTQGSNGSPMLLSSGVELWGVAPTPVKSSTPMPMWAAKAKTKTSQKDTGVGWGPGGGDRNERGEEKNEVIVTNILCHVWDCEK